MSKATQVRGETVLVRITGERTAKLSPRQEHKLFVSKGFKPLPPITFADVAAALRRHPMSHSRFGVLATGDGALVAQMRAGRQIGFVVQNRIRAFIERLDGEAQS